MNALAGTRLHAAAEPRLRGPDRAAIERAIEALEAQPFAAPGLDAAIHRALGWEVQHVRPPGGGWRYRSPIQMDWQLMRRPTAYQHDAAALAPHGWSYGAGMHGRQCFAWTAQAWPIREGVPFFECSGLTVALALTRAALFAHRWCALRAEQLELSAT